MRQRIEAVFIAQKKLLPDLSSHIDGKSRRIAALLTVRGVEFVKNTDSNGAATGWCVVNVNEMETIRSRASPVR